jgi:hypothetical protein
MSPSRHTRKNYGKFSAHSPTQAVARARALGILPSTGSPGELKSALAANNIKELAGLQKAARFINFLFQIRNYHSGYHLRGMTLPPPSGYASLVGENC